MSRLAVAFARARDEGRAALVGYLPAGYPSRDGCVDAFVAMAESGVDIFEVGLPYSDPVMDGPVIQAAVQRALEDGVGTRDVIDTVCRVVEATGVPTVVMTYWNPVERYGVERFAADLCEAGGVGVITPDLLPDEAADWLAATDDTGLDPVFVVAPSSTGDRLRLVTRATKGFVYAASTMGVTGARSAVGDRAGELVGRLRAVTALPVAVGLGVSSGRQAAEIAAYADGVIVGAALVRAAADETFDELRGLSRELAAGVRRRGEEGHP